MDECKENLFGKCLGRNDTKSKLKKKESLKKQEHSTLKLAHTSLKTGPFQGAIAAELVHPVVAEKEVTPGMYQSDKMRL